MEGIPPIVDIVSGSEVQLNHALAEAGYDTELIPLDIVGLLGWQGTDASSPASRVGFSELFGGSFDGPLQLWFALLCYGGAPSPRPAL
jgi:hypothetical protein